jgi:hypothetical protein
MNTGFNVETGGEEKSTALQDLKKLLIGASLFASAVLLLKHFYDRY